MYHMGYNLVSFVWYELLCVACYNIGGSQAPDTPYQDLTDKKVIKDGNSPDQSVQTCQSCTSVPDSGRKWESRGGNEKEEETDQGERERVIAEFVVKDYLVVTVSKSGLNVI